MRDVEYAFLIFLAVISLTCAAFSGKATAASFRPDTRNLQTSSNTLIRTADALSPHPFAQKHGYPGWTKEDKGRSPSGPSSIKTPVLLSKSDGCRITTAAAPNTSERGPHAVGIMEYEFESPRVWLPIFGGTKMNGVVFYPAEPNQLFVVASNGSPFPIVFLVHGATDLSVVPAPYHGFDELLKILASHGIIAVSINVTSLDAGQGFGSCPGFEIDGDGQPDLSARCAIVVRAEKLLDHINFWVHRAAQGTDEELNGIFGGKVDIERIGLAGHSRGGEVILRAYDTNKLRFEHKIRALYAMAPTDFFKHTPSSEAYLLVVGSKDSVPGVPVFDRAAKLKLSRALHQAFIHGLRHYAYLDHVPPDTDDPILQSLTRAIGAAFFRRHLKNDGEMNVILQDFMQNPRFLDAKILWSYHAANGFLPADSFVESGRVVVDNFEDEPENPLVNSLSGNNTVPAGPSGTSITQFDESPLMSGPVEGSAQFDHETRALLVRWQNRAGEKRVNFAVPDSFRAQLNQFDTLSFRVASVDDQSAGSDFSIRLETDTGTSPSILLSDRTEIAAPHRDSYPSASVLQTVRIPLRCFKVSPTSIQAIEFHFDQSASGWLAFDDIQFTK